MVAASAHHKGSTTSASRPSTVKVIQKTLRSTRLFYSAGRLKPRSQSNRVWGAEATTGHAGTGALARSVEQGSTNACTLSELMVCAVREIKDRRKAVEAVPSRVSCEQRPHLPPFPVFVCSLTIVSVAV